MPDLGEQASARVPGSMGEGGEASVEERHGSNFKRRRRQLISTDCLLFDACDWDEVDIHRHRHRHRECEMVLPRHINRQVKYTRTKTEQQTFVVSEGTASRRKKASTHKMRRSY